jgi:hypothetical protein
MVVDQAHQRRAHVPAPEQSHLHGFIAQAVGHGVSLAN